MFCLRTPTDPGWARAAVADLDSVLIDHAHCEMKAATNALSLVVRHPDNLPLVQALTELAREELEHFRRCLAFLERRGLSLGAPPVDAYAAELRKAMSALPKWNMPPIVDRLITSALIEARSCERFKLLIAAFPNDTAPDMKGFYEELFAAEARHYRTYLELAVLAVRGLMPELEPAAIAAAIDKRVERLADGEGKIVSMLADRDQRATVHG